MRYYLFLLIFFTFTLNFAETTVDKLINKMDEFIESVKGFFTPVQIAKKMPEEKVSDYQIHKKTCLNKCHDDKRGCEARIQNDATAMGKCHERHCECVNKCGNPCT